jgi:N-acetylmuramoyl-L-alanine amidase
MNFNTKTIFFLLLAMLIGIPGFNFTPKWFSPVGVKKVVIDAGHGGKDPGNLGTGRYKSREKDVALQVALKLGKYIKENLPDVEVIYTRTNDRFVELHERAAIANRNKADLFISIHCDAFTNPQAFGASSYVMGQGQGDKNMRVAIQENAVISLEENFEEKYEGFDPNRPETYIALSLYQNAYLEQSVTFAQMVQDQFRTRAKRRDRGVKQQPLVVTSRTAMPAVLIELGFLTNKNEEDFLQSESGQNILASAIFRAFRSYKEQKENIDAINTTQSLPRSKPIFADEEELSAENETQAEENKDDSSIDAKENPSLYFAVQISVSSRNLELKPENFGGLSEVHQEPMGNLFRYLHGRFPTHKEASMAKKLCIQVGYKDAYIVAYHLGERISIEEALKIEKKMQGR